MLGEARRAAPSASRSRVASLAARAKHWRSRPLEFHWLQLVASSVASNAANVDSNARAELAAAGCEDGVRSDAVEVAGAVDLAASSASTRAAAGQSADSLGDFAAVDELVAVAINETTDVAAFAAAVGASFVDAASTRVQHIDHATVSTHSGSAADGGGPLN